MEVVALVVGYIWVIAVSLFVVGVAVAFLLEAWERIQERNRSDSRELAAADFANCLESSAYWFSEDEATMKLLQLMAAQVRQTRACGFNANAVREEWRKLRESAKA